MKNTKVLCIDDDPMFGLLVQHIFKGIDNQMEVVTKQSTVDGLNYLRTISSYDFPRIILLDINMYTGGGFEFLKSYRDYGFDDELVSVFLVSSSVFPEDQRKATDDSLVSGVYTKPFRREDGEEVINIAFNIV
tara:strand:- start:352 stop:750 length:399 start_codon:yes stop_codon:yes gene_type:complete